MLASDELGSDPVLPNINQFKSYIQYSYNEEQYTYMQSVRRT
jgi:hypothetical protein